jgi:excisionase family DNA binding protein
VIEQLLSSDALAALDARILAVVERALDVRERERRWLDTAAAAEYLGVTPGAIRKMVARGQLPYTRLNERLLIDRRKLDRLLQERAQNYPHG